MTNPILLETRYSDDGEVMRLERIWDHGGLDIEVCAIGRYSEWPVKTWKRIYEIYDMEDLKWKPIVTNMEKV